MFGHGSLQKSIHIRDFAIGVTALYRLVALRRAGRFTRRLHRLSTGARGDVSGWNHNVHYHDALLSAVPAACGRALDVGCGLGAFARRLAERTTHVDAIDADASVIARAREQGPATIQFHVSDFLEWTPPFGYDFISMIAVLHHLPFEAALAHAERRLNPGGVLAVLGLDRAESLLHEGARSALAWPVSRGLRLARTMTDDGVAIREPDLTVREIRGRAERILSGAEVRRRLLWRYSLLWTKPGGPVASARVTSPRL